MCGFAGFIDHKRLTSPEAMHTIGTAMGTAIQHRGPDAGAVWADAERGICLSHRRLSIIDLSAHGAQPMHSATGRYVIAYNGEIYNFEELRPQLNGPWRGHSDTEVLLAAIEQWGLEETLPKLDGMFAFALWDTHAQTLTLARDRMGEKPLYYSTQAQHFFFGSELKALRAHADFVAEIDADALPLLLRHNYIPAPYSIYKNVQKLLPGHYAQIDAQGALKQHCYYDAAEEIRQGVANPLALSDADALEQLKQRLGNSIRKRMVADVPLGAFLSGGIDSSLIVSLMQVQSELPIHSFTMGFDVPGYNEAEHAKAVAKHLGTQHTEMYVTPKDALEVIPKLPALYDEPFADVSQIPTHMVSQIARSKVTVALSGDAGDELFAGYNRYFWGTSIWQKLRRFPTPLRGFAGSMATMLSVGAYDGLYALADKIKPMHQKNVGEKIHKLAGILNSEDERALYTKLISQWQHPLEGVVQQHMPSTLLEDSPFSVQQLGFTRWMQGMDMLTYLPDDILCKVDRAAMGVSLETRIPFLDPAVVSFAMRLPREQTIRHGKGKWLLRQLLYKYVPAELIERPKMGFGVPIDHWLRSELRDWAEALLDEKRLEQDGYFNTQAVREMWDLHQSGTVNRQYQLWPVLMFQMWKENYG